MARVTGTDRAPWHVEERTIRAREVRKARFDNAMSALALFLSLVVFYVVLLIR